jgi:ubiquinone/menaquinone biosynthesis C-methylase UbiE
MRHFMYYQVEARARQHQLLVSLDLTKDDFVVDVGCGTGYFSYLIGDKVASIVGVDIDSSSLRVAKRFLPEQDFILSDATQLPIRNQVVTKVLCSEVLEHVSDDARLVSECYRILRMGGVFVCSSPNATFPMRLRKSSHLKQGAEFHVRIGYSPTSLRELLIKAGFESVCLSFALSILGTLMVEILERMYTIMYGPLSSQSELVRLQRSRIFRTFFPFLLFVVGIFNPKGHVGSILVAKAFRTSESGRESLLSSYRTLSQTRTQEEWP